MNLRIAVFLNAFLLFGIGSVSAHGLGMEAKLKGDKIRVESFFDDDTPCIDSKVTVEDEEKKVLLEGKTDAAGAWEFPIPKPGKYRIIIDGGDGHKARRWLTIPEAEVIADSATVSDGPTRSETTGWTRYLWAAAGIIAICLVTLGIRFGMKRTRRA